MVNPQKRGIKIQCYHISASNQGGYGKDWKPTQRYTLILTLCLTLTLIQLKGTESLGRKSNTSTPSTQESGQKNIKGKFRSKSNRDDGIDVDGFMDHNDDEQNPNKVAASARILTLTSLRTVTHKSYLGRRWILIPTLILDRENPRNEVP